MIHQCISLPYRWCTYYSYHAYRPVTLLSVLVFQGEGVVLQTVLQGEGGGIAEIRERGSGISFFEN